MATLHPPYALDPDYLDGNAQRGLVRELTTLQWLATALPASFTVFHSTHVAWTAEGQNRKREADFLVLSPSGRVLMIEQKTGQLLETDDGLMKVYGTKTKSVVTQCHQITDQLREKFRTLHGEELGIQFLLFCPQHRVRSIAAAGLTAAQIVDAPASQTLIRRIRRLLPDERANPVRFGQVRDLLAQTVALDPDPQALAAEGLHVLTRLTDGLSDFLAGLEMSPWRLRLDGAAGCGKTRLVAAFAERWQAEGRKVLVACYNRPLADELRASLPESSVVETVHGIARGLLAAAGTTIDFAARVDEPDFWPRLLEAATEAALLCVPPSWTFDALVVDEGQDVDQPGFDLLRLLLPLDAPTLWLEDANQRLRDTAPFAAGGFVTYRNRDNYRTPRRIALFLHTLLPFPFTGRNPMQGDPVGIYEVAEAGQLMALAGRIDRLLDAGYLPEQIVVLVGRGQARSSVLRASHAGAWPLRRADGFHPDGTVRHTGGEVRAETLWRFKGQQAPAVIVCELDGDPDLPATQRLLYCAFTRACAHLEVLVAPGSKLCAALHRAAGQANAARLT